MSNSVASGDASSTTASEVLPPPSPAVSRTMGDPFEAVSPSPVPSQSTVVVEPVNPFEATLEAAVPSTQPLSSTATALTPERPTKPQSLDPTTPPVPSLSMSTSTELSSQQQQQQQPLAGRTPDHNYARPPSTAPQILNTPSSSTSTASMQQQQEDDSDTAPSSAANTKTSTTNLQASSSTLETPNQFSKFIENTRRRISGLRNEAEDDDEQFQDSGAVISGYLQKLGRNGKWQTRWFESDGECLSYYKSNKRTKLMATLDLQKVGLIEMDTEDTKECSFRIQVLGRLYHLRADSRAACKDWVIMLNRVKEARLEQGNVKLVAKSAPVNLLSQPGTPRVVVVANRQRTRAVDEEDQWDKLIREDPADPNYISQRRSTISTAVVARWTKRHSSLQRLGAKLSKWARSLKKYSCADMEQEKIILDRHVHPPGHDDKAKKKKLPKPATIQDRSMSTNSEYDARMIS